MKQFTPSDADRRQALGILVAGIGVMALVLYFPLLKPWWDVEVRRWRANEAASESQKTLARARAINSRFAARREHLLSSGNYLPESTAALANAGLAQRLQQAALDASTETSVCVLGDRQPVDDITPNATCKEARMRIDMQCGGAALQQFLHLVEDTSPNLRIDAMTLGLAPNPLGFDKPMSTNQPLNVTFEVAGCLFPDALSTDAQYWGQG